LLIARTLPATSDPVRTAAEITTGIPATTPLIFESVLADPELLVAVTTARNVSPTSAATGVYVVATAPLMLVQVPASPAASQRRH
jgi:hypothetical protein